MPIERGSFRRTPSEDTKRVGVANVSHCLALIQSNLPPRATTTMASTDLPRVDDISPSTGLYLQTMLFLHPPSLLVVVQAFPR